MTTEADTTRRRALQIAASVEEGNKGEILEEGMLTNHHHLLIYVFWNHSKITLYNS